MTAGDIVAIYAAIVATGALALEVRRWAESGPRIDVRVSTGMMMIGGSADEDETDLLMVTVYNRGSQSTTITHMLLHEYPGWWARLRNRPSKSFLVPHPQPSGAPAIIPKELGTGAQWIGLARSRPDVVANIETGKFWAGIQTTARDRPFMARIRKRPEPPQGENI